ncbi:putative ATP-grasp-modified RiPP [Streptomyces sp. JH002]|uniref:putative ATP-grasp-modified RiPP n=1 Tax=Streptomyces sp. JH002 TaxID=2763259 RepID=UPI003D80186B
MSLTYTPVPVDEGAARLRPFGLRTARPVTPENVAVLPHTTYCPDRQLALTDEGVPLITAASTGTTQGTGRDTRHDMQWMDDSVDDNDTDAPEED